MRAAAVGLAAIGHAAWAGPPCAQPPANCQQPDQLGHGTDGAAAATSDLNASAGPALAVQDNLIIDQGGSITSVCWWGLYLDFDALADCSPGGVPDIFFISYFDNVIGFPGKPGALKAGPFLATGAGLSKAPTGNVVPSVNGDLDEYVFSATHPAVAVEPGECVWIQIQADTTGSSPSCFWLWSTAPNAAEGGVGDGVSWQQGLERDYDMAFCVNHPLGDPSACALEIDPGCGGAVNVCNLETSPDPGCADQECCTLVCTPAADGGAGLPFCCVNAWSQQCVDAAVEICGPPSACGVPGTGTCFLPHGDMTPFCNDAECCTLVCSFDPYCCGDPEGGFWDLDCSIEALLTCDCMPGDEPANDDCADAVPIGLGDTPIDNACATTSPPSHATCNDGFLAGLGLDVWYTYTADFTGRLLVSTCNAANYDTLLAVYDGCDCGDLGDPPLACNNNGPICIGFSSQLLVEVVQGSCYTIRVGSGHVLPTGTGTLTLAQDFSKPCALDGSIPPGAMPEGEACGEDVNGGCENDPDPPAFTPVQFGDVIHGTAWADGGTRDKDWYELVLTETTEIGLIIESEFPALFGLADTNLVGSGDCLDFMDGVFPGTIAPPCEETFINVTLGPGTWWPLVTVNSTEGFPCGTDNDYVLQIAGPPCPWDCDGSADGNVNIADLLAFLGQYDVQSPTVCTGGTCDFNGDGCVDVVDLLKLLSHYTTDPGGIGCPQ